MPFGSSMFCHDRSFTIDTDEGVYQAVVTAAALRMLNDHVEMFNWGEFVHRHREQIYEAALRKFKTSGLDAQGRIIVGPHDLAEGAEGDVPDAPDGQDRRV